MSSQQGHEILLQTRLKLSILRAMLGEVTSNLRSVGFKIDGNEVKIYSYYDGIINDDTEEDVSCMESEVISDFWQSHSITWKCIGTNSKECLQDVMKKDSIEHLVYLRKE